MDNQTDPIKHMLHSMMEDVTPVRLRLLLVLNCLGILLFLLITVSTILQHKRAVDTVGVDAAPSVIAAHQIKIAVEQMDTALANELLYRPEQPESLLMEGQFERAREVVSKQLVSAAKNITFGKSEQTPIENIQLALGQFEMQAQYVRDMKKSNKNNDAVNGYLAALQTVQENLLPNADALNKANSDLLESNYEQEKSGASLSRGGVSVVGILLVALSVYSQLYLKTRFRRRINLPLLIGSVCTLIFLVHITQTLGKASNDLKVAKEDAYNSIFSLLDARANAYEANAAESRWLVDQAHADVHEKRFQDMAATVAKFAPNHNYDETIARARKQQEESEKISLQGFTGSLAEELSNVRFEGEGREAIEALQSFSQYVDDDTKMRKLKKAGQQDLAVQLCLAYDPTGSKYPFTRFDEALGRTLAINQEHFDRSVKDAFRDLQGAVLLAQCVCLLMAVCVYLGFRPRLAEYV